MRQLATVISTSRDSVEMLKATGGDGRYTSPVRVSWVPETLSVGALTPQNVTFGTERIYVHTSMAEAVLSQNLIEDTAFPIESYLSSKLSEAAAIDENDMFLTGDGVGHPMGILPGGANSHAIRETVSGSNSAITWDGLISLTFNVPAQYRSARARWLAEKATYEDLALLKDANGQYLWRREWGNNAGEGSQGNMAPLMGYGTLEHEAMPSVATSAFPVLFGEFSGYYIVDRIGMTIQRFLDGTQARQNTVLYVMKRRLGGQLLEPWRLSVLKIASS
jgi:HK97 family phage major capsid protein